MVPSKTEGRIGSDRTASDDGRLCRKRDVIVNNNSTQWLCSYDEMKCAKSRCQGRETAFDEVALKITSLPLAPLARRCIDMRRSISNPGSTARRGGRKCWLGLAAET